MMRSIAKSVIFILLTLVCMVSAGQSCVTKSGTRVVPTDRLRAELPLACAKSAPLPDPTAGTYLVVSRPDLAAPLQPLLRWKRQQGYRVELLLTEHTQCDSIRAQLVQRYQHASALAPAQRYVLIVGDVDRIPSFWGKYNPSGLSRHVTDLYYGEYTGDYLPEAWVGRLSVADSTQLAQVVGKLVDYQQGRWASAHRLLLTAGKEDRSPAPTTTNGQVNYLARLAAECRPELDTICYRNPQSDSLSERLIHDIDQHNALVNYTAHCTSLGWSAPLVNAATIDTLGTMTPTVFVNNCCLSNAFNSHCFGESLLRHPTAGAVGVIGATNESLWLEDYLWAVGAHYPAELHPSPDSTLPGGLDAALRGHSYDPEPICLGALNYAGCSAVTMAGSPYDAFYWEIYNLLGDPSMTLFWDSADSLVLQADSTLAAGSTSLSVVTSPFARVSATTRDTLLATTLADAAGHARLTFGIIPTAGVLTLTATRPEAIPCCQQVRLTAPVEARLAATSARIVGDSLWIELANVGQADALNHSAQLAQDSGDTAVGNFLPDGCLAPRMINLSAGSHTTLCYDISNYRLGDEPMLLAHVRLADAEGMEYGSVPLRLAMYDIRPQIAQLQLLEPDGTPATVIYAHHSYLIAAQFTHICDSMMVFINDTLLGAAYDDNLLHLAYQTPSSMDHLHLAIRYHSRGWSGEYQGWIIPYRATEDFESGTLDEYPWMHQSLYPWHIDSTLSHTGRFSLRSSPIDHGQKSTITLSLETLVDDSVAFYYHVSSEAHDWLYFYIDGRRCGYWSGNQAWSRYARAISAGHHTLQWIYQKDASVTELSDCAHIDDIQLPICIWQQPYGHATPLDEPTTGVEPPAHASAYLYAAPNPTSGAITIHLTPTPTEQHLTLYDSQGRAVDEIKIAPNCAATQYSTLHLRLGIYHLVWHNSTQTRICKIIVTR